MNIMVPALVLVVFVLKGITVCESAKAISGDITAGDIKCTYIEYKPSGGKGPRGLRLCGCKNDAGPLSNSCLYYGKTNPHNCKKYNKDQEKYYKALAKSAMANGSPCSKPSITENICDLTYPCDSGDCLPQNGRKRRDVDSGVCPLLSPNSASVNTGCTSVCVSVLITFLLQLSK